MFWRKTRAAIAGFHPLHQTLIWERTLSATLTRAEWTALLASLAGHAGLVRRRKWALPDRTESVIVPLIRVLCEDAGRGAVGIRADLRGPGVPGKATPPQELPTGGRVRAFRQWWVRDQWLSARSELRDGSVLTIDVSDFIRYRRVTKINPRGKRKTKVKTKGVQRIRVVRSLAKGQPSARPGTPPPRWIQVRVRPGHKTVIKAAAKLPMPDGDGQFGALMTVLTEPFRWTAQARRRSA